MAIRQAREGVPGSEQHLGVDVGAQAGTGRLGQPSGDVLSRTADAVGGAIGQATDAATGLAGQVDLSSMKVLKPLPHGVIDYAMAGTMLAAPWLFGFSRNRKATSSAVGTGAAILGLSLMTRYPLGAVKLVSFPTHGVIETVAGLLTATAPWLMGFSRQRSAKLTHLLSGLGTLAVVAMTDYQAAEAQPDGDGSSGASA